MPLVRLQKFLSQAGACSRRKGEDKIRSGQVKVNGRTITVLGTKIDPEKDQVELDGVRLTATEKNIYIALNKPKGVITSCDHGNERIVLDLVTIPERIYPVGRLDKDSTGLLILTNDGALHHRLSHPSHDHEKEYYVRVAKTITDGDLKKLAEGVSILGRKTRPAVVKRIAANQFRITLKEGRNRQIRRMVEKVDNRVIELKRTRIAGIALKNLAEGNWRHLTRTEIQKLKNMENTSPDK